MSMLCDERQVCRFVYTRRYISPVSIRARVGSINCDYIIFYDGALNSDSISVPCEVPHIARRSPENYSLEWYNIGSCNSIYLLPSYCTNLLCQQIFCMLITCVDLVKHIYVHTCARQHGVRRGIFSCREF